MDNTQHNKDDMDETKKSSSHPLAPLTPNMTHSDTETTVVVTVADTKEASLIEKEITSITRSEETKVKQPERAALRKHMQCLSSSSDIKVIKPATIKRQPSSMSNIDLFMHEKIPPRILPRDASYSFIWIDDHFSDEEKDDFQQQKQFTSTVVNKLSKTSSHDLLNKEEKKRRLPKPSTRGFCNVFTIVFIISIVLFLFLYPFITLYFIPSSSSSTTITK